MIEVRFRGNRDKWGNIHSYRFGTKRMEILRNALREYGIETRYNTRADFREARQYGTLLKTITASCKNRDGLARSS